MAWNPGDGELDFFFCEAFLKLMESANVDLILVWEWIFDGGE